MLDFKDVLFDKVIGDILNKLFEKKMKIYDRISSQRYYLGIKCDKMNARGNIYYQFYKKRGKHDEYKREKIGDFFVLTIFINSTFCISFS